MNGAPDAGQSRLTAAATSPGAQHSQQQQQEEWEQQQQLQLAQIPPDPQEPASNDPDLTVPVLLDRVAQLEQEKGGLEDEIRQMHQQLRVLSGFLHVVSSSVRTTEDLLLLAVNPPDPHTSVPSNSTATPVGSLAAAAPQQAGGQAAAAGAGAGAGAGPHAPAGAAAAGAAPEALHGSSNGFARNASNAGAWGSSLVCTAGRHASAGGCGALAAAEAGDGEVGANGTPDSDPPAPSPAEAAAGVMQQAAGSSGGMRASPEDGSDGVGRASPAGGLAAGGLERSSKRAKTSHRAAAPASAATQPAPYPQQQQQLADGEQPATQQQLVPRQQTPPLQQQEQLGAGLQQQTVDTAAAAATAAPAAANAAAAAASDAAAEAPVTLKVARIKGPTVLHGDDVVIYRLELIRHGVFDKYLFLPNDTLPLYGVRSWQHRDAIPQELLKMVENCLTTKSVSSEQYADEVKAMKAAMLTQCPHLARWGLGSNKVRLVTESGLQDLVTRLHRTSQRHSSVLSPKTLEVDISWVSHPDTPEVPVEEWTAPIYSRRLSQAAAAAAEDAYGAAVGADMVAGGPYMMHAGLQVGGLLSDDSNGMATSAAMAAGMHLSAEMYQQHLMQIQQQQQQQHQQANIGVMTPVVAQMHLSGQQQQQALQQQSLQLQGQLQQGLPPEYYHHHQQQQQQHLQQLQQLYVATQHQTLLNQAGMFQQQQQQQPQQQQQQLQVPAHAGALTAAPDPSQGLVSVPSVGQGGLVSASSHTATLPHSHSGVVLNLQTQSSRSDYGSLAAAGSVAADATLQQQQQQPHHQQQQQPQQPQHLAAATHAAALAALPAQLAGKLLQQQQMHTQQQLQQRALHSTAQLLPTQQQQQLAAQQQQQAAATVALAQQQQALPLHAAIGSNGSNDSIMADAVAGLQALRHQGSLTQCPTVQPQPQQLQQQQQLQLNLMDVVGKDLHPVRDQHAAGAAAGSGAAALVAAAGMPAAPGGATQGGPAAVIAVQQ